MDRELRARIREVLGVEATSVVRVDEGWDSRVFEVDGEWIVRVPRREEVREWMRREAALLGVIAPALPVPVPGFVTLEDPSLGFFVAYRKLTGEPLDSEAAAGPRSAPLAAQLGRFLGALHTFPVEHALQAGLAKVDAPGWLTAQAAFRRRCEEQVMPMLAVDERRRADAMFEEFYATWSNSLEMVVIHADLGPEHVLHRDSSVSGIIDWSDGRLGDAALDFAWLLHGTNTAFATLLLQVYEEARRPDAALRPRSLFYHRLGPWYEVLYGLEDGRPDLLERGLAGLRRRLPRADG